MINKKWIKSRLLGNGILKVLPFLALLCFLLFFADPEERIHLARVGIAILGAMPFVAVLIHRNKIRRIWILQIGSIFIFLLSIELGLYIGPFAADHLPKDDDADFASHPMLGWVPKTSVKGEVNVDVESLIQLDRYKKEKSPGVFRIITLGGSNTYGWKLDNRQEECFTTLLGQRLQKEFSDQNFECINAGVPGYTMFHSLVFYGLFLRDYRPDLVIVYTNANESFKHYGPFTFRENFKIQTGVDLADFAQGKDLPESPTLIPTLQEHFRKSRLYNFMVDKVTNLRESLPAKKVNKNINPAADYEKNLEDLITLVHRDGGQILLADAFNYVELSVKDPPYSYRTDHPKKIREIMARVANKNNVPFLAVHTILSEKRPARYVNADKDPWHLNKRGHETVAKMLANKIEEARLINQKEPK